MKRRRAAKAAIGTAKPQAHKAGGKRSAAPTVAAAAVTRAASPVGNVVAAAIGTVAIGVAGLLAATIGRAKKARATRDAARGDQIGSDGAVD